MDRRRRERQLTHRNLAPEIQLNRANPTMWLIATPGSTASTSTNSIAARAWDVALRLWVVWGKRPLINHPFDVPNNVSLP
jgi:hypothetical protein